MNYRQIYNSLIQKRRVSPLIVTKGLYTELHHVLPKSLGGSDAPANMVRLTGREHYVAHKLLAKAVEKEYGRHSVEYSKMFNTVLRMTYDKRGRNISSRDYMVVRKRQSERKSLETPWNKGRRGVYSEETKSRMRENHADVKGQNNPMFGRRGKLHPKTGKHISESAKERIGAAHRGKKISLETRRKISESRRGKKNPMFGCNWMKCKTPAQIQEWKEKISSTKKMRSASYTNGMLGKHLKDFMTENEYQLWLSHHHHLSGKDNPSYGKVWMFNESQNKRIYVRKEYAGTYLLQGYVYGTGTKGKTTKHKESAK